MYDLKKKSCLILAVEFIEFFQEIETPTFMNESERKTTTLRKFTYTKQHAVNEIPWLN